MGARNLHDLVAAPRKFLTERKPNFFNRTSHDWRDRKKRAEHYRDLHIQEDVSTSLDRIALTSDAAGCD